MVERKMFGLTARGIVLLVTRIAVSKYPERGVIQLVPVDSLRYPLRYSAGVNRAPQ